MKESLFGLLPRKKNGQNVNKIRAFLIISQGGGHKVENVDKVSLLRKVLEDTLAVDFFGETVSGKMSSIKRDSLNFGHLLAENSKVETDF